jgi:hypothetical protein
VCWGSYDSDYRGLKKRITVIRRAQGSSAGSHVNVSSESELDIFPRESGASAHRSDGEEIVDEGHKADNETSIHSGRHTQQTVVDARDGEIELKELNRGHSKVDTVFFFLTCIQYFPKVAICSPLDTTSASQLAPVSGEGRGIASAPTPETQPSTLPPHDPRPRDGLRRRTTGRSDYIFCLIPRSGLTLSWISFPVFGSSIMSSTFVHPLTLAQVLESMSPVRLAFFDKLDMELSKIESFFVEREGEARTRSCQLREQLEELKDHRRLFHVSGSFVY